MEINLTYPVMSGKGYTSQELQQALGEYLEHLTGVEFRMREHQEFRFTMTRYVRDRKGVIGLCKGFLHAAVEGSREGFSLKEILEEHKRMEQKGLITLTEQGANLLHG